MKTIMMFYGTWCSPCVATKPAFNQLRELSNEIDCQLIDIDKEAPLAKQYNIRAVPTFVLLKDGVETARMSGSATLEKLQSFVNQ